MIKKGLDLGKTVMTVDQLVKTTGLTREALGKVTYKTAGKTTGNNLTIGMLAELVIGGKVKTTDLARTLSPIDLKVLEGVVKTGKVTY